MSFNAENSRFGMVISSSSFLPTFVAGAMDALLRGDSNSLLLVGPEQCGKSFCLRAAAAALCARHGCAAFSIASNCDSSHAPDEFAKCLAAELVQLPKSRVFVVDDLHLLSHGSEVYRVLTHMLRRCRNSAERSGRYFFLASCNSTQNLDPILQLFEKSVPLGPLDTDDRRRFLQTVCLGPGLYSISDAERFRIADGACRGFGASDIREVVSMASGLRDFLADPDTHLHKKSFADLLASCAERHTPISLRTFSLSNSIVNSKAARTVPHLGDSTFAASSYLSCMAAVGEVCDWRLLGTVDETTFSDSFVEPESDNADSFTDTTSQPIHNFTLIHSLQQCTPLISFADIVGNDTTKASLSQILHLREIKHESSLLCLLGIRPPTGVLLYGPPGTGKTLLAQAFANSFNARFINVPLPAVLRAGVGESERALASAFAFAQAASPSVLFFDEIQSLFAFRANASSGASDESDRLAGLLMSQLLNSLDALASKLQKSEHSSRVLVVAATNRLDLIDAALLQPGRFDRTVFVPLPSESERTEFFTSHLGKIKVDGDEAATDISRIALILAANSRLFSYAAIAGAVRLAAVKALLQRRLLQANKRPTLEESFLFSACSEMVCNWPS